MAVCYVNGFELPAITSVSSSSNAPVTLSAGNFVAFSGASADTQSTEQVRSGQYSAKLVSATGGPSSVYTSISLPDTSSSGTPCIKFSVYIAALPASGEIMLLDASNFKLKLSSSGILVLRTWDGDALLVNNIPIKLNAWNSIYFRSYSVASIYRAELVVNNGSIITADTTFGNSVYPQYGLIGVSDGGGAIAYYDDVVAASDPGDILYYDSKLVLLLPISDNQRGSWTGGAGGTTNLYDAINNVPPIGTATETNLTQIESADSSGNNSTDEYRINMSTYSSAGIGTLNTILRSYIEVFHGEDVQTGTKTFSFGVFSNPAGSLSTSIDVAPTSGALATFPTAWFRSSSVELLDYSAVDVNSSPVINLRKTDTTTRVVSICAVYMYVEYLPPPISNPAIRAFPRPILNF